MFVGKAGEPHGALSIVAVFYRPLHQRRWQWC